MSLPVSPTRLAEKRLFIRYLVTLEGKTQLFLQRFLFKTIGRKWLHLLTTGGRRWGPLNLMDTWCKTEPQALGELLCVPQAESLQIGGPVLLPERDLVGTGRGRTGGEQRRQPQSWRPGSLSCQAPLKPPDCPQACGTKHSYHFPWSLVGNEHCSCEVRWWDSRWPSTCHRTGQWFISHPLYFNQTLLQALVSRGLGFRVPSCLGSISLT